MRILLVVSPIRAIGRLAVILAVVGCQGPPDDARPSPRTTTATVESAEVAPRRQALPLKAIVKSVGYSADGKLVYAYRDGGIIEVWDRAKGMLVRAFRASGDENYTQSWAEVVFGRDGKLALVNTGLTADGRKPTLWAMPEGRKIGTLPTGEPSQTFASFAISPAGDTIAGFGYHATEIPYAGIGEKRPQFERTGYYRLWDVSKREITRTLLKGAEGSGGAAAFSPDGKLVLLIGCGRNFRVWDVATGAEKCSVGVPLGFSGSSHFMPSSHHVLNFPDGPAFAPNAALPAQVYDIRTGRSVQVWPERYNEVRNVIASPTGGFVVLTTIVDGVNYRYRRLVIRDAESGTDRRVIRIQDEWIGCSTLSPDGKEVIAYVQGENSGGRLLVWDVTTGVEVASFADDRGWPTGREVQ